MLKRCHREFTRTRADIFCLWTECMYRLSLSETAKQESQPRSALPPSAGLSKGVLVASGMLLMFLLESLFWPGRGLVWRQEERAFTSTQSSTGTTNPSWGAELRYVPIALDRPEEYFTNELDRSIATVWTFRHQTESDLVALFKALDFSDT